MSDAARQVIFFPDSFFVTQRPADSAALRSMPRNAVMCRWQVYAYLWQWGHINAGVFSKPEQQHEQVVHL